MSFILYVPTYAMPKGLKDTGFLTTNFCNPPHEPTQTPSGYSLHLYFFMSFCTSL